MIIFYFSFENINTFIYWHKNRLKIFYRQQNIIDRKTDIHIFFANSFDQCDTIQTTQRMIGSEDISAIGF